MRGYLKDPLIIATLFACLCGLLTLTQPLDQIYWNTRFRFGQQEAPQSVIVVSISDDENGRGKPWTAEDDARLLMLVSRQLPKHIYYDRTLDGSPDRKLVKAFADLPGRVTIVARYAHADTLSPNALKLPTGPVLRDVPVVVSGWYTNFWGFGIYAPYLAPVGAAHLPTFSADLAKKTGDVGELYRPDFTIDPNTIRTVRARQLLDEKASSGQLAGQTVIISATRDGPGATIGYFGNGRLDPITLDIAGAAGLRSRLNLNITYFPLIVLVTIILAMTSRRKSIGARWFGYSTASLVGLGLPIMLERQGIYCDPSATFAGLSVFGSLKLWDKWRRRVTQTSSSGLPNFTALADRGIPDKHNLVVATIGRYEEFLATLPKALHGECARQIARRFSVSGGALEVFHGDGGLFAWIEPARTAEQIEHFEGLRALFSAPLLVGGHIFDTNVHFGLDHNYQLDTLTRINTALASASEALKNGRTIELFEANRLANAPWELSLLARIDEGMRNGDIWLAYQPQWDYQEMRISGAEALIRWNDPVRGLIRPDEFILQAERAGRIDALTYWVLDQAITAAQAFHAFGPPFQMSINLSAQLVDKPSLVPSIAEVVRRRTIDPQSLTVEVTETASVYNRPAAIANLLQLRTLGFRLSIDDFGTGEASLCYLAELPSDELKLDRRFVSWITRHERERKIVMSTIDLAHALGQTVVAEGIEDMPTFDMLRQMGCDVGQGYYIGRPETFEQLRARYAAMRQVSGTMFKTC